MNIQEKLMLDLKDAMKSGNIIKKNTIQLLRASILTEAKNTPNNYLTESQILDIVFKERKKRYDALGIYEKANRPDLTEQTQKEILYISNYLPQPYTEAELRDIVTKIVNETSATSADMGAVIRKTKEFCGTRADGKIIAQIVKEILEV